MIRQSGTRRDLLVAATGLGGLGGIAVGVVAARAFTSPQQASAAALIDTQHATVLADPPPSGTEVSVKLDNGQVQRLPYAAPYVPVPDDRVAISIVSGGGNTNAIVIGGHSGRAGNLVVNGDFTAIAPVKSGKPPLLWSQYKVAGGRNTQVFGFTSTNFHKNVMVLQSLDQTGEQLAVSAAFPVKPGEVISGHATVSMDLSEPMGVDVDLRIAWLADINGGYPKPLTQNVLDARSIAVDGDWVLAGDAKAPATAGAARVAVRAKHAGPPDTQYVLTVGSVYATR